MGEFLQQFQVMTRPLGSDVLKQFPSAEGRYSNFIKEVYFVRYIGVKEEDGYLSEICRMDDVLQEKRQAKMAGYLRIDHLEHGIPPEKTETYLTMFDNRENGQSKFPFRFQNGMWEEAFRRNYEEILDLFQETTGRREPGVIRNFGVKLLYWIDAYFPKLFLETMKMRRFPKFVCSGQIKLQEYLFLYYLVLMGCDVLYLNPEQDVELESDILLRLSCLYEEKTRKKIRIPSVFDEEMRKKILGGGTAKKTDTEKVVISWDYVKREKRKNGSFVPPVSTPETVPSKRPEAAAHVKNGGESSVSSSGIRISIPKRPGSVRHPEPERRVASGFQSSAPGQPLDYVELAKRASSIVMIGVYNKNKECFKTGSGVIISEKGYILTNFHVASEAAYYGIRLEEEEHIFFTDELIKYNQYHDLAILRVDRPRAPIPIYRGDGELVRGQKVVAIGSPLGLFNTVSDGIISGFRKLEDVSMIQFTAPTSHGSSGGALLDLYGNLIGVITAGYDDGQNLNLAVDYKTVWLFAKGFV